MTFIQFHKNRSISIFLLSLLINLLGFGSIANAAPGIYDIKLVEMVGRPGHQGLFPIQGQPVQGSNAIVQSRIIGFADKVNLVLRNAAGGLLSKTPMIVPPPDKVVSGTYFADIVIPSETFTMSISGADQSGNEFEAKPPQSVNNDPQSFDIRIIPTIYDVSPGFPIYFTVRITNYGLQDTFNITLTSDIGGTIDPTSKSFKLGSNQTADVQFLFTPPTSIQNDFSPINLTAKATSVMTNGDTNQAELRLRATSTTPQKLTAWVANRQHRYKGHKRKHPLIIGLCNKGVDSQTILLANSVSPVDSKVLPLPRERSNDRSSHKEKIGLPKHIQCGTTSLLKLKFNSKNLIAAIDESIGLTNTGRIVQIPITANSTNGAPMIGYLPLVLGTNRHVESKEGHHEHK